MKKLYTIMLIALAQIFAVGAYAAAAKPQIVSPRGAQKISAFEGKDIDFEIRAKYADSFEPALYASDNGKTWYFAKESVEFSVSETVSVEGDVKVIKYFLSGVEGTTKFKCEISDGKTKVVSGIITATMCPLTKVKSADGYEQYVFDGADKAIKDADCKAKFAVKAEGVAPFKYQWYVSESGSWMPIARATAATYTTPRLSGDDFKKQYMVIASNAAGSVMSSNFKAEKAEPAKIMKQPSHLICANTDVAEFTVQATPKSGAKLTYKWQRCDASLDYTVEKNWKSAGTKQTLTINKPAAKLDGAKFRCLVSNAANAKNPAVSDIAVLGVLSAAKITKPPRAVQTIEGNKAVFECTATGSNLLYIWESSTDGKTWTELLKGDSNKFELDASKVGALKIRCRVQSRDQFGDEIGAIAVSAPATLTVRDAAKIKNILAFQLGAYKESSAFVYYDYPFELRVDAEGSGLKYQWYESFDGGATFTPIRGGTAKVCKIPANKYKNNEKGGRTVVFKCEVSNKFGMGVSSDYKHFIVALPRAPVPETLAGLFAIVNRGEFEKYYAAFLDKSNMRVIGRRGEYKKNSTYSFKRISPVKATISFTIPYRIGEVEQKLSLKNATIYYDFESGYTLEDKDREYVGHFKSFESLLPALPAKEFTDGMRLYANGSTSSYIEFTDIKKKQCVCVNSGKEAAWGTFTYAVKSETIGLLSLNFPKTVGPNQNWKYEQLMLSTESGDAMFTFFEFKYEGAPYYESAIWSYELSFPDSVSALSSDGIGLADLMSEIDGDDESVWLLAE